VWWLIKVNKSLSVCKKNYTFSYMNAGSSSNQLDKIKLIDGWSIVSNREVIQNGSIDIPYIILQKDGFRIVSDHFGHHKYFVYRGKDKVLISNRIEKILENIESKISKKSVALYALGYHYLARQTLFEDIEYSRPGTVLTYDKNVIAIDSYWSADDLILQHNSDIEIKDIAKALEVAIESRLNSLNVGKVSHAITGGIDSRILLSILLKLGIEIHGYTYGNVNSVDVVIAKKIAKQYNIPYKNYDIKFAENDFAEIADKSIELGDTLCSLHRAHRIKAIEQESEYADTMLLGTMGGEFVKGANRDDYIVSNFIYEFSETPTTELIEEYFGVKGLKSNAFNVDEMFKSLVNENYVKRKDSMELYSLVEIAAGLHHSQNFTQYRHYIPNVITPYCDINYLETLFQSKYNFLHRRKTQNKAQYKLSNPRFGSRIQDYLNKDLATMRYSYQFSAKEYLISPYYAGLLSKLRKKKYKYSSNFPLGNWMADYVKNNFDNIKGSDSMINDLFEVDKLRDELNLGALPTTESFWLKYTTPIQIYRTLKIYGVE